MRTSTRVAGLTAVIALAAASAAQAHPGFYSVQARVANTYEQQTITVTAVGTFKPSANATDVAVGAPAGAVESALWADPAIGYDNVDVSGPNGGPYAIRFTGTLAGRNSADLAPVGATVVTDQQGGTPVTPATDPTGASEATQTQYVIVNDGYTYGFTETNKLGPNTLGGGGFLNLKFLPGAYRATLPAQQWLTYPGLQTGIQAHAVCAGVAALADPANIVQAKAGDPFFDYIPWQKTSSVVGGDEDPAAWIAVVKNVTGVDLGALSTVADFQNACTGLGGTYVPADTRSNTASALIADAVAPLNTQIVDLRGTIDALTGQNGGASGALALAQVATKAAEDRAAAAEAEVARLRLQTGRLTLKIDGPAALDGTKTPVRLTGPANAPVLVRLVLSRGEAAKLRLTSRVLGTTTAPMGSDGTGTIDVAVARKLVKAVSTTSIRRVTVDALSGDRYARIAALGR